MNTVDRIGIIVQARMLSQRLPGKMLRPLAGRPLLQYVLERVSRCRNADQVVVSTSVEPADDPIRDFCAALDVDCCRGSHENVAQRFLETIKRYDLDAFVRVCGDSPLIDPQLIDQGLETFRTGLFDIVTNNLRRSYPSGQTVEIFGAAAFRLGCERMHKPAHREHVTRYFYENPDGFRIHNFTTAEDYTGIELAVDTVEDFNRIEDVVSRMEPPHWQYGLREIVERFWGVAN